MTVLMGEWSRGSAMAVDITQDDIDRGRKWPTQCPAARAIRRLVGRGTYIYVDQDLIEIGDQRYDCPQDLAEFISIFDEWGGRKRLEPASFLLSEP